jgi:RNA polymerase sigma factor (sigma-70 family)
VVADHPKNDGEIGRILEGLSSREPQEAWDQFLAAYSPIVLQVIQAFEREPDFAGDCFVFVCEQLRREQFRRLRRFRPDGSASFATWLRVVVRNLCLDWHRREFGRLQIFRAISRLDPFDQEVFRSIYHRGLSREDCILRFRAGHPDLTPAQIEESLNRIQQLLTPRQRWLLQVRRPRIRPLENGQDEDRQALGGQILDLAPDPETLSAQKEQEDALARAVAALSSSERLLIKLRFDQELTLLEIARLMDLKDAQTADRRIRDVLEKLRTQLS